MSMKSFVKFSFEQQLYVTGFFRAFIVKKNLSNIFKLEEIFVGSANGKATKFTIKPIADNIQNEDWRMVSLLLENLKAEGAIEFTTKGDGFEIIRADYYQFKPYIEKNSHLLTTNPAISKPFVTDKGAAAAKQSYSDSLTYQPQVFKTQETDKKKQPAKQPNMPSPASSQHRG